MLLQGKKALIYNASFDTTMLVQTSRRYGIEVRGKSECVMEWYAAYFGEWSQYYRNFRWQPLPGSVHSALGDCKATLELIKRMAASIEEIPDPL